MGKIGDLFVRLGLKKDEFSRGMKGAAKDSEAFAKTMQAVGKAVKMAWAGLSAAIVKFANDALKMTNKWGDAWAETVAGAQAAYGVFVRQLSSGEGWTDLFSNMREAAMLQFPATAAAIVREMTEEIKREAERHGHSLTVAAMNEAKRQAGQAPGGSKKKPLN